MNTNLERDKRFEEMMERPIMTAEQRIKQMKREREMKKNDESISSSKEPVPIVQTQDDCSKKPIEISVVKKKKNALTFDVLRDSFRPMKFDLLMPTIYYNKTF